MPVPGKARSPNGRFFSAVSRPCDHVTQGYETVNLSAAVFPLTCSAALLQIFKARTTTNVINKMYCDSQPLNCPVCEDLGSSTRSVS